MAFNRLLLFLRISTHHILQTPLRITIIRPVTCSSLGNASVLQQLSFAAFLLEFMTHSPRVEELRVRQKHSESQITRFHVQVSRQYDHIGSARSVPDELCQFEALRSAMRQVEIVLSIVFSVKMCRVEVHADVILDLDLHKSHNLAAEPIAPMDVVGESVERVAMSQCRHDWMTREDAHAGAGESRVEVVEVGVHRRDLLREPHEIPVGPELLKADDVKVLGEHLLSDSSQAVHSIRWADRPRLGEAPGVQGDYAELTARYVVWKMKRMNMNGSRNENEANDSGRNFRKMQKIFKKPTSSHRGERFSPANGLFVCASILHRIVGFRSSFRHLIRMIDEETVKKKVKDKDSGWRNQWEAIKMKIGKKTNILYKTSKLQQKKDIATLKIKNPIILQRSHRELGCVPVDRNPKSRSRRRTFGQMRRTVRGSWIPETLALRFSDGWWTLRFVVSATI